MSLLRDRAREQIWGLTLENKLVENVPRTKIIQSIEDQIYIPEQFANISVRYGLDNGFDFRPAA